MVEIKRLIWTEWTISHIAKHDVTIEEAVEECFGNPIAQEGHTGRLLIIGPTQSQRMLTIVVNPEDEEGVYKVVTARPAARKERRIYKSEKDGDENDQTD
ncbi:MAG: BrnT family toxin [Anaerolineae bacterium]|nr:BrnT family toxin [Anaerolineae bacterium]